MLTPEEVGEAGECQVTSLTLWQDVAAGPRKWRRIGSGFRWDESEVSADSGTFVNGLSYASRLNSIAGNIRRDFTGKGMV